MKVKGIKALCSASKGLSPVGYLPNYKIHVHINTNTGELIWADIVGNGYIHYHDPAIRYLFELEHPATMKEIREEIEYKLSLWKAESETEV